MGWLEVWVEGREGKGGGCGRETQLGGSGKLSGRGGMPTCLCPLAPQTLPRLPATLIVHDQAFAVAVPAVAMVLARRCSLLTKLGVGLLSTAAVPAAIYVLMRSLFAKYVKKSLHDDLANIEGFYSTHGAGAGSAFWVAELVEPVAGAAESGAPGSATAPAYKRTSSTGLLSAPLQSAVTASSAASAPQALQAPALTAAASSSATPAAQEPTAVPAQTSAQAPAGQDAEDGSPNATSDVAAASGQREPAAAPAVPTSVAATAQDEPEASSSAAPDTSGAAASTASTEAEDPEAEARRVVAGLVASAVRRLEAAATMAAPSGSAPPASPGPKANGASAAGASGLASPRAGSSAVKKPPAAAVPAPAAPPVQVASPAAAAPKPAPVPVSVPAHPAMAIVGSPSPAAAAKPVTSFTSLAAAASLPRTPSSAAFNGTVALAPATRTRVVGHVALERKTWQVRGGAFRASEHPLQCGEGLPCTHNTEWGHGVVRLPCRDLACRIASFPTRVPASDSHIACHPRGSAALAPLLRVGCRPTRLPPAARRTCQPPPLQQPVSIVSS